MKLKEIDVRIGNLVFDDEQLIVKIERIESQKFNDWNGSDENLFQFSIKADTHDNMYGSPIFGIPLTEKWLTKRLGFTNELIPDMYNSPSINYHIVKHTDKFIFRGLGASVIEVKTVHHLQNLYYFLTGEELEVKP